MDSGKLYLSAAIKKEMDACGAKTIEELAGSNRIIIKSPVGAGKNYFCMHELPRMAEKKPVLFMTSRQATVEQIGRELQEIMFGGNGFAISQFFCEIGEATGGKNFIYGHSWDLKKQIAEYLTLAQQGYFKYIVMDECHSLTSDSMFADAPLAVFELLGAAAKDTTVILMSACPERVLAAGFMKSYKLLDFSHCHKAEPQKVEIMQGTTAKAQLHKANSENKILYYVADTKRAYKLEKELNGAGLRAIAITSQKGARENVYSTKEECEEMELKTGLAFDSLREHERFPEDVDIIIATSKLREGINIKDHAVKTVITDLRDSISLIQCAGRVRHGVENFYIIDGTRQFTESDYMGKYQAEAMQRESYNQIIHNYEQADRKKNKSDFINNILKKHPGILYYSEERDEFLLNPFYLTEQEQRWEDANNWKEDKVSYIQRIMEREQVIYEIDKDKLIEIIEPYCGRRLDKAERVELLDKLNAVLPLNKRVSKKVKTILEKVGYTYKMERDKKHYTIERNCEN